MQVQEFLEGLGGIVKVSFHGQSQRSTDLLQFGQSKVS
jgi:hypothetical protein